jgi:acetyltransferase-like isoleucine patch superfamily enzyme
VSADGDPRDLPLLEAIRSLRGELAAAMSRRYDRDLPFDDLVFDRWERARELGFGKGASIYASAYVYGSVEVGADTWIGPMTMLDGSGGITIGHHCSISAGVHIYSHDTVLWALSAGEADAERAPVVIGDCTYVGGQTTILKGTTIGDHCVIGAGSLVNRDLPPRSIAYGAPAVVRGSVEIHADGRIELVHSVS